MNLAGSSNNAGSSFCWIWCCLFEINIAITEKSAKNVDMLPSQKRLLWLSRRILIVKGIMHVNNILTLQFQKNSKSRNIKLLTVYLCIIIDHFNISVHYQRSTCISRIGSHAVVCSVWSGVWSGLVDILIGVIMNSMV